MRVAAELFRTPLVGPFLIGRAVAAIGTWMDRIALGWLMWEATGSATWVGALAFLRLAPAVVLGPWGGVIADRLGSITVLRSTFLAIAVVCILIAFAVVAGVAGPLALLVLGALLGGLQSLANGPLKSALSEVAPRHLMATAIPVASVTFNAAAFVGPAIAGVTIAWLGAAPVFVVVAGTSLAFAAILARLPRFNLAHSPSDSALRSFTDAGRAAASHPVIGPLMVLHAAFALLLRPIVELLPAVAGALFAGGPSVLALLTAATGLGAFAGSLWLTWRSTTPGHRRAILAGAALACFAALLLAATTSELQGAACFAALGGALVVRAAGSNTAVQLATEHRYLGRTMALWGTVLRLGTAIGGLVVGFSADLLGMRPVLAVCAFSAFLCLAAVGVVLRPRKF